MKKILVIEDDEVLCSELRIMLNNSGYDADSAGEEDEIKQKLFSDGYDLVLLDINLPGTNGEELLKEFRKRSETPVIMLTSRTTEIDELISMSCGADDFITKPYNPTILLLRISAVLKRASKTNLVQKYHDAELSSVRGTLTRGSCEQSLTKNEMIIFQLLLERQGEIVTRDAIMTALWDNDEFVNDNALSVNISRLRGKLSELGYEDAIVTRKKLGYVLK